MLSLCSGYGGLDLGLHAVLPCRTVGYVEHELTAAAILVARMEDGALDSAPIWDDLHTFDGRPWRGVVDIVTAGFPCQPFSQAGKRGGDSDPRHLWPAIERIIGECQPQLVFLENVPGLLTTRTADGKRAIEHVVDGLRSLDYRVEAEIVSAAEVGAPHQRERLFILGVADTKDVDWWRGISGTEAGVGPDEQRGRRPAIGGAALANTSGSGRGWWSDDSWRKQINRTAPEGPSVELPLFPPGPADRDAWRRVLAVRPDLAPAVADTAGGRVRRGQASGPSGQSSLDCEDAMADTRRQRSERRRDASQLGSAEASESSEALQRQRDGHSTHHRGSPAQRSGAEAQSTVRRMADGTAGRLDLPRAARLRALGNGVVPAQAAWALWLLLERMTQEDQ